MTRYLDTPQDYASLLDETDKKILRNLRVNNTTLPPAYERKEIEICRTQRKLSELLDTPYSTILYRLNRLEELEFIEIDQGKTNQYRGYFGNSAKIYRLTDYLGMHFERGESQLFNIGDVKTDQNNLSGISLPSSSDNYPTPKIDSTHHITLTFSIDNIDGPTPQAEREWDSNNTHFKVWKDRGEKITEDIEGTRLIIDKLSIRQSNCSTITATYRVWHYRNDREHLQEVFNLSQHYLKELLERHFNLTLSPPKVKDRGQLDIKEDPLSAYLSANGIDIPHIKTEVGEFDNTPDNNTTHIDPEYMMEYLNTPKEIAQLKETIKVLSDKVRELDQRNTLLEQQLQPDTSIDLTEDFGSLPYIT